LGGELSEEEKLKKSIKKEIMK
jgi:hypothetical protein